MRRSTETTEVLVADAPMMLRRMVPHIWLTALCLSLALLVACDNDRGEADVTTPSYSDDSSSGEADSGNDSNIARTFEIEPTTRSPATATAAGSSNTMGSRATDPNEPRVSPEDLR